MSKPLRNMIGLLLLLTTVSLASCQSLYNSIINKSITISLNSTAPVSYSPVRMS